MLFCLGISCQHPCSTRKEAALVGACVGTKASEHGLLGLPSHPESSQGEKSPLEGATKAEATAEADKLLRGDQALTGYHCCSCQV